MSSTPTMATVESLDHEGRGVARVDGKTVFIEGALPKEQVEFETFRSKAHFDQATTTRVVRASSLRVQPRCPHFGVCGGCSMQHLDSTAQGAVKQRVLENTLWHIGRLTPELIYPAILGPSWGYRFRARLGVRCVPSKGGVLVGFHERKSSYITNLDQCPVLPPQISAMLPALRALVAGLSIPDRLPQIEVAVGDNTTVLVFRHLLELNAKDCRLLSAFGEAHGVQILLQPTPNPQKLQRLYPAQAPELEYVLPEFDVRMQFRATDFTQVNVGINRLLMRRAMQLLDPQPGERIADLFCGLGNFTLPIARSGATVIGVEGSDALVARALDNAKLNGLSHLTQFYAANLFEATEDSLMALGPLDKLLIDPPRDGAMAVCRALNEQSPRRIVYVSCNPATLARDAAILVHEKGYQLRGAGIANMFPQTSHVESIALFER